MAVETAATQGKLKGREEKRGDSGGEGGSSDVEAAAKPSAGSQSQMTRKSLPSAGGGGGGGGAKEGRGAGGSRRGGKEGAGGAVGSEESGPDPRLKIYSVLPPCLAERARAWGSCLTLREGVRQTDAGFFDAPGAAAAACLVPSSAALAGAAAPPVTVVFASVDNARMLRRRTGGADVTGLLRTVLRSALHAVPGSYLCREIDGSDDIRYMLAFPSAPAALTFCLLVQEAAMYAPWPQSVLDCPEWREVHAPGDGALLFRGPRLRMGLAEGIPRSLVPDCAGRADYYGTAVNLVSSGCVWSNSVLQIDLCQVEGNPFAKHCAGAFWAAGAGGGGSAP